MSFICAGTENRTPISSLARTHSTTKPYPRTLTFIEKQLELYTEDPFFLCLNNTKKYVFRSLALPAGFSATSRDCLSRRLDIRNLSHPDKSK